MQWKSIDNTISELKSIIFILNNLVGYLWNRIEQFVLALLNFCVKLKTSPNRK